MKQFASWTTATLIVKKLWETIKKMIQEVIKLDKAFTNIQMVTGYTNQQMEELNWKVRWPQRMGFLKFEL